MKHCTSRVLLSCLLLSAAIPVPVVYAQVSPLSSTVGAPLREIQVVGAQRVEPATIASYMDIRKGDPLNDESIDRAVKSLYATGLFADVSMSQKGDVLMVHVAENPLINEIAFEGNDRISDETLLAEIQLRPRQVFTRSKVQEDSSRLYDVYQRSGRFAARIEPKIIQLDQNRINLVFEVDEGNKTKVKAVRFVGNDKFSDDRLRDVISTNESRWYNFLSSNDQYDEDRISYDQEQLRTFYLSRGYADFQVISAEAEMSPDRESFYVTFTVDEGKRYRVGKVGVRASLKDANTRALEKTVTFEQGDWYNAEELDKTIDVMTKELGNQQYAFVTVRPETQRNPDTQTIDVVFSIDETPRVFVERVDIHGNLRTQDKVIRREMRLIEGDPFNRNLLSKSEQDIKDLGFFDKVTVRNLPGSAPDKTVIDIEVSEQSTGEISLGAGFSTADGPLADVRYTERNFLGKGQEIGVSTTIAGARTEFDASFTEPYFLDRDISAGVDAFHITRDFSNESSYDQRRSGGALRMGYPLSEHWRQTLKYRLETNEIRNVEADASRYVRDQEGSRATSAISQRLAYDNRDSALFPTTGWMYWLETEYAGLGGDADYVSGKTGAGYYYPVWDQVVFNVNGEAGVIQGLGSDVEINERFFIGSSTLRGFQRSGIGPRDTETNDALGGNMYYRASTELSFPLGLPKEYGIQGHAFNDIGTLWSIDEADKTNIVDESSLRSAAGLGVSWRSPIGPVRLDFSYPYMKEDFDQTEYFRFNFGTRF